MRHTRKHGIVIVPARSAGTTPGVDGCEPADVEVGDSHYIELPELPSEIISNRE